MLSTRDVKGSWQLQVNDKAKWKKTVTKNRETQVVSMKIANFRKPWPE